MKTLALIFVLPLAILCSSPVSAKSTEQTTEANVAIQYIKKLAKDEVDLNRDTAISEHCGIQRRKVIREQLTFLRKTHFSDGDTFTVESQQTKGDFAAVLLRAENSSSPLSTRIHALALVRKKENWLVAPLPGSFANTDYGYDESVEKTVRTLELWMAREKATRESQARRSAEDQLLTSIKKEEKSTHLESLTKKQAALNFITQCRKKNLFGVLAALGGASDKLTDSLATTVHLVSQGLGTDDTANDWQLVTNPSVIVQAITTDSKSKEIAIGFWNPLTKKSAHILYFSTHQFNGKIFVKLPHPLRIAMLPERERWQQKWQHIHHDEDELIELLPNAIFKNNHPIKFPDGHQKLRETFIKNLNALNFKECIRLLPRNGEYFGKKENQRNTLTQLSRLWGNLYRLRTAPRRDLNPIEDKNLALLPLQYAKPNRPGEFQIIKIWLIKESDGWHLIPEETLKQYADKHLLSNMRQLESKMRSMDKEQQEPYPRSLMEKVVTISPPLTLAAVENETAEKTLTHFRLFLRSKDTASALSTCAVLKGTSNTLTLKNFNYAIRGAADHRDTDHILAITRAGKWLGISLRTESKTSGTYDYPLYLIANTNQGPKIILDIDLRYATNKGRKLLNSRNWSKLEKSLPKASQANIKTIFTKHEKLSAADIKASEPIKD